MSGAPKARNKNKYYEFHKDKGHNINDCLHLIMQIEEAVKLCQSAHLVKEIKQSNAKASTSKTMKKCDQTPKDKGFAILVILLRVVLEKQPYQSRVWMNFLVVKSPSQYNGISSRPGIRSLGAVPSTAHGMMKFLTMAGVATIVSERAQPLEIQMVH
ncbi:hypothetical protein Tco_1447630 [Tanacetum coccineum]